MKEGVGAPGQHPFNGRGGEQRKVGWWKATMQQEGGEREREGEGGVLPRPVGMGSVARPCHAASLNRGGGGRLTGGPRPQCWAVAPVDRRAWAAQCRVQTNLK
jgi:hypothetical protein